MNGHDDIITRLMAAHECTFTLEELSRYCQLPEPILIELFELGIIEKNHDHDQPVLNSIQLTRIQKAARLSNDLKINASGVVLVLELLDQIKTLRQELSVLRRLTLRIES